MVDLPTSKAIRDELTVAHHAVVQWHCAFGDTYVADGSVIRKISTASIKLYVKMSGCYRIRNIGIADTIYVNFHCPLIEGQ